MKPVIPTLIETIRVRDGVAPLWHLHLRRLSESCRALGVPLPLAFDVPAGGPDRVIRLEVGRKGMTVTERPVPPAGPVDLVTAQATHAPYPHKTTFREPFDRAREEAEAANVVDALLLTPEGMVAECALFSIFWWEGEGQQLVAPPLGLGVLRSVSRLRIEELVGDLPEVRLPRAALGARSAFVANAVRGILPVLSLDGLPTPADPRTQQLARAFWP